MSGFTISKANKFLFEYQSKLTEPTKSDTQTKEELDKRTRLLKEMDTVDFHLAFNLKTGKIFYQHRCQKNFDLKFKSDLNLGYYFQQFHPDYIQDILKWAIAVYLYAEQLSTKSDLNLSEMVYRVRMPMKIKGTWKWVLQTARPLQFDENNLLYSHLNQYTIIGDFIPNQSAKIIGSFWTPDADLNDSSSEELSQIVKKIGLGGFSLTNRQEDILRCFADNLTWGNEEVADEKSISVKTVETHNKKILRKARAAFPNMDQEFTQIRKVAQFLKREGFLVE